MVPQDPQDNPFALGLTLASVQAGAGAVIILTAPAPSGAGELLAAAGLQASARGMTVMRASGRENERPLPFGAAVELFERTWAGELPAADRTQLAAGPARAGAELLEGSAGSGEAGGGFAVIRGLAWLARRLAERSARAAGGPGGLALVIDDLQDLDGPSLRFLAYLAGRLDTAPIAIVGALRPGVPSEDPLALSAITTHARLVRVPSLTPPEVVARTRAMLPGASPRFCAACAGASAGNAGLLDALLAELRRRGVLPSDAQAERVEEIVPDSVFAEVAAQLARLPRSAQALARAVAGLGEGVPLDRALAAAQLPETEGPDALDALVAAEVLTPGLPPAFAAPLVRRAVRASLTVGQQLMLGTQIPNADEQPPAARIPGVGVDSLTPSERRVGELAGRGMTTREIAATLFVTTKTVEFHLRNVYRKLDVPSSRSELTRILGIAAISQRPAEPGRE